MTVFDLLFILAVLASFVTLTTTAVFAVRGRRAKALVTLRNWGLCAAAYFAIGIAASLLKPQRVMATGEPWCFDDWCLTVAKVTRTAGPSQTSYNIGLTIFSRAGRVSQRANGAWIYLVDDQGHHYAPEPDPSAVPLNVLLGPHESVSTSRVFRVPSDAGGLGLITGHGGPYCGPMAFLIIGEGGCLFNNARMIRIQ
jgi:hypothetical protein